MTVNVTEASEDYDIYGDLYASSGTIWVAGDYNNEGHSNNWSGLTTVQLYFEGDQIYNSTADGPYTLGYVRLGADVDGSWMLLDEASNVYTTTAYNYTDFETTGVAALTAQGVSSISDSNDPFSPNNDGTYDTTLVTVSATAGQTLYLNIYNSTNVIKRTGLELQCLILVSLLNIKCYKPVYVSLPSEK